MLLERRNRVKMKLSNKMVTETRKQKVSLLTAKYYLTHYLIKGRLNMAQMHFLIQNFHSEHVAWSLP